MSSKDPKQAAPKVDVVIEDAVKDEEDIPTLEAEAVMQSMKRSGRLG
jgi:hypothetical protein